MRMAGALLLVGGLVLFGCGGRSNSVGIGTTAVLPRLPLTGETPTRQAYRLEPGPRQKRPPTSWCLRLRLAGSISATRRGDGTLDSLTSGGAGCGPRPQKPVSGFYQPDCDGGSVFIFGGATAEAGKVTLATDDGKRIPARQARAPKGSGYSGTVFLVAASLDDMPGHLRSSGAGPVPRTRFPSKEDACVPIRKAAPIYQPDGPRPLGDFP